MERNYRHYERVRVPEDKLIPCEGVGRPLRGHVSVVGLGGLYIRTRESYPVGTVFDVRLGEGEAVAEASCVVRSVDPGGLGVEFVKLRGKHEETLKKIIARLKS